MDEDGISKSIKGWVHMMHDVYMINWDEPNFEKNHRRACEILETNILTVSGIKGIHAAHYFCAKNASSDFFWCIDGDNWLYDTARIDMESTESSSIEFDSVYVMRARNPFNNLVYGHGAIKLFPRVSFLNHINMSSVDMTSGTTLHYKIIHKLTSEHRYNSTAFHTWRTAFRECAKLSSSIIKNQNQKETDERLQTWCNPDLGSDVSWANENIHGAIMGRDWGRDNAGTENIGIINDFDKLRELFEKCQNRVK